LKVIVFGNGWLGKKFAIRFKTTPSNTDILDLYNIKDEIKGADWVINAAGKCGVPNIDWCENNKKETTYSNTYGPAIIEQSCLSLGIRFLHLSSGCLWESGIKNEEDAPDPNSFYAKSKAEGEKRLNSNALILRLRMPFDSIPSSKNLITKLSTYPFVIDVQNSITCVDDLLNAAEFLMNNNKHGIFNVVNKKTVSGVDIMNLYCKFVNSNHKFSSMTMNEFHEKNIINSGRSNVVLNTDKLENAGFIMPLVRDSLERCLINYSNLLY
jgi:3,5-epimerase/4-reductase